jgi:hypothetical protein
MRMILTDLHAQMSRTNPKMDPSREGKGASSPSIDQLKSERDSYDQHLAVLRRKMNDIQTRRNMSTLVNAKIPAEVFSIIFHYTKLFHHLEKKQGYSFYWIPCVSHVCRHWRSIALSNPSLWTDGIPKNVDAFKTFLTRSKNLPIVFEKSATSLLPSQRDLIPLFLSQAGRVRELYVDVLGTTCVTSEILKALDADMPLLEVFHMSISISWPLSTIPRISIPRPENLQHVRDLDLFSCGFNWNQVELNNLTSLCFSGGFSRELNPSVEQIFDVLKRSPRLQKLDLSSAIKNDLNDPEIPPLDFSLPHLKHLLLATPATRFIKALVNPVMVSELESINIEMFTPDEHTMMDIFITAAKLMKEKNVTVVQTLGNKESRYGMFAYFHGSHVDEEETFSFTNTWERSDINRIDVHQAVLACLEEFNLDRVAKFDYSLSRPLPEQCCRDLLSRFPALEVLRVECSGSPGGLISALTPHGIGEVIGASHRRSQDSKNVTRSQSRMPIIRPITSMNSGNQSYSSALLPSLRRLVFFEAEFTPSTSRRRSSSNKYEIGSYKHLAHCIELRKKQGFELELLAIPCTSEDLERSGARLRQDVTMLACLDDEGVEETENGLPEVVIHDLSTSLNSDSDSE